MTVKELIKHLQHFDKDTSVNIEVDCTRATIREGAAIISSVDNVTYDESSCILNTKITI